MANKKELIDQFIEDFKTLPIEERVATIATKDFLHGHITEDPKVAAAFNAHHEKKQEFYKLVENLKLRVEAYCWQRLDDVIQQFILDFGNRPLEERQNVIFDFRGSSLETYLLPNEDLEFIKKIPSGQEEPFYVLVTLLQMKNGESQAPAKKRILSHPKQTLKTLIGTKA